MSGWGPSHAWPIDGPERRKPSGAPVFELPLARQARRLREVVWGCGLRWAFGARAWCGWFASLPDGRVLLRREQTWFRVGPDHAAQEIIRAKLDWKIPNLHGGILANPDLWPKEPGQPSDAETFLRMGLPLRRGTNDRLNGFACVRKWLAVREQPNGETGPSLLIHPDCTHLLRTLPMLVSDPGNVDDVQACAEEYPAVGLMLYLMSRPMPAIEAVEAAPGPGTWGYETREMWQPARGGLRTRYRYG